MADSVIVSSDHTFERSCVHAYASLSFHPTFNDAAVDFSAVIPNLALRSTFVNWCLRHHLDPLKPHDFYSAEKSSVKEILGTCISVGCTVDGKDPKDLQQEITDGDIEVPLH